MTAKIEYRVRPVTRYIVTRFVERQPDAEMPFPGITSSVVGEFVNQDLAASVAEAFSAKDANVNRVVWEPMEEPPPALPTE